MKASADLDDLKTYTTDKNAYILYLLRVGAFKTMSELAEDMGVSNGWIRQIKHRAIYKRSNTMLRSDYTRGVLRLWNTG